VFDAYLKRPPKDWSAIFLKSDHEYRAQAKAEQQKRETQRVTGTSPSLPLEKYVGSYTDTLNGDAVVRRKSPGLVLQYGTLVADLAHWQYDTFQAIWRQRRMGKGYVTFTLDATGKVDAMNVVDLAEFRRKPEQADTTPGVQLGEAELPRYTGSFASPSLTITAEVQLVNGHLKLTVPGQPVYILVPVTTTRFRLTGDDVPVGFFLDYTLDGGKVRRVTLVQPVPQPALTLVPKRGVEDR